MADFVGHAAGLHRDEHGCERIDRDQQADDERRATQGERVQRKQDPAAAEAHVDQYDDRREQVDRVARQARFQADWGTVLRNEVRPIRRCA